MEKGISDNNNLKLNMAEEDIRKDIDIAKTEIQVDGKVSESPVNEGEQSGKRRHFRLRKTPVIVSVIITIFIALSISFSWYLFTKDNHADTDGLEVMAPYFLYLLNPDDRTSLEFSVGNIHPGETKQVVICVSNKIPEGEEGIDIARESMFNYDLEFIYTENLKVNYDVYELKKEFYTSLEDIPEDGILVEEISDSSKVYWKKLSALQENPDPNDTKVYPLNITRDATDDRLSSVFPASDGGTEGVFNTGKYILYQYDSQNVAMGLEYKYDDDGNAQYEFDYYLVEISWQADVTFNDYTKETDLVYVVVNAKQPEPIAQD